MVYRIPTLLAAAALFAGACSDDDPGEVAPDASAPDASAPAIDASAPDALDPCTHPTSVLLDPFRPVDAVSTGAVVATGNAATVDATAGGSMNAADNPYVYLKFTADSVTKVEISDIDSYTDESWDFALKRFVLRVNGGDSGPGGVEVATVAGETLADVTAVPADGEFSTDDWFSDACTLNTGPLAGEPATALVDWYDYDVDTHLPTPKAEIHVLRRPDGSTIKLDINNYRYQDNSGHYEIEWGAL
jgi:hypothetical protein